MRLRHFGKGLTRWVAGGVGLLVLSGALLYGVLPMTGVAQAAPGSSTVNRYAQILAQKLGISTDQLQAAEKSARDQYIDEEVAAGRLTQQQAQDLKNRDVNGGFPGIPGMGGPHGPGGPGGHDAIGDLIGAAASKLGITREALMQEMQGGKTLAQVAAEHNVSRDQLKAALTTTAQTAIQQALTAGNITQSQATELTANLSKRIDDLLDRAGGQPGNRGGRHFGQPPAGAPATPQSSN